LRSRGSRSPAAPIERGRALLEALSLGRGPWFVAETFDDGAALFAAVCGQGLEGVVAKRRGERSRPGERRWIKTKNRDYWRYGHEVDAIRRRIEARVAVRNEV
jgi:ATP-dependent DNA ligase